MMLNMDLASPFTAVLSLSVAAFTALSATIGTLSGPPIMGSAEYAQPVRAGETIQLQWTFHKRGECAGENSRVWSGERGFHLTEQAKRNSLPVTADPISPIIPTHIPEWAPPGRLEMRIQGECVRGNSREPFTLGPVIFDVTE